MKWVHITLSGLTITSLIILFHEQKRKAHFLNAWLVDYGLTSQGNHNHERRRRVGLCIILLAWEFLMCTEISVHGTHEFNVPHGGRHMQTMFTSLHVASILGRGSNPQPPRVQQANTNQATEAGFVKSGQPQKSVLSIYPIMLLMYSWSRLAPNCIILNSLLFTYIISEFSFCATLCSSWNNKFWHICSSSLIPKQER